MLSAQTQYLAIHRDHFNAKHIICGQPVFQAMHPARIFSDIAAN